MEVLIAAGVTAVGLFGVLALIPLAAVQVGKGITEDRKAVLGKSAVSDMHVRGYRRPETWLIKDPSTGNVTRAIDLASPNINQAFCIDPRFVAVNSSVKFPYLGTVAMFRVSLRASPGNPLLPMDAQLADDIFRAQDDLEFRIPNGDRTQPAVQQLVTGGAKRQSTGNYSWLAMVVPKHGAVSDEYVLSIVIFNKRDQTFVQSTVAAGMSPKEVADVNERVVQVTAFNAGGVGGGEVRLQAATQLELEGIVNNSWLMLAGPTNSVGGNDFKWYRVLATDDILPLVGAGPFTRNVTLQGADWQRPEWSTATQATIMAGVVGVFEKTVRLETTSLWTN